MKKIYQAVLEGDLETTVEEVKAAIAANVSASNILQEGLIAAMGEVGRLFEDGDYFVPEMLVAARAMQAGLEILKPLLVESGIEPIGKVVIGTVKGDLHDIGKNLVAMMLGGAGFEIVDLGVDVSPEKFIAALTDDVDILGLSALLTTTMPSMENTIKAVETAGLRDRIKIIIGGAPVTADYAKKIGADGFASDAGRAVTLAKSLLEG
ncbi:MAG: corrinoid protein [Chloroflexi bacterium]|nr:corrinoid protein [Chloroflexota bacterium]